MPGGLLTDLYELDMAASYLRRGMTSPATFSLFVRNLPPDRGYLVAAGIEDSVRWLEELSFAEPDLEYLASLGFGPADVEAFRRIRFTGDVWALPEGSIALANEPLIEVTAPLPQAQLVETYLLNQITFQTNLASKAARCRVAAGGRIDLVEFGFRRTQGIEAGMAAARLAAMVGFTSTSNVEAARRFGLEPAGTMAHSYVEAFPTEVEAFRAFAEDFPGAATFLVDTYDTAGGVGHAIEVIRDLGIEDRAGVRLDSGDLAELAAEARRALDCAGMPRVRIFVSGGLDEYALERFVKAGAPIDAAGLGTKVGVSADAPYLDSAYKLVEYGGVPVAKLSAGKATLPGAKQVFRGEHTTDVIAIRGEPPPAGSRPLLEPVMSSGQRTRAPAPLRAARSCFEAGLADLPREALELAGPEAPLALVSPSLRTLTAEVRDRAARRSR